MIETKMPDYPKGATFEQVWAALMEIAERQKETDRKFQEVAERQMREVAERRREIDLQIKETNRHISKLGGRFGEVIEYMVMPNLLGKFRELGFVFSKAYPHAILEDENRNFITEIDITLEDGDKVMLVEVKTKPDIEDIKEHVERMEKVRAYVNKRNDKRKYLGAIAGMVINENVKIFAFKNGFYIIQPSADTFDITAPEGCYTAREW